MDFPSTELRKMFNFYKCQSMPNWLYIIYASSFYMKQNGDFCGTLQNMHDYKYFIMRSITSIALHHIAMQVNFLSIIIRIVIVLHKFPHPFLWCQIFTYRFTKICWNTQWQPGHGFHGIFPLVESLIPR